MMSYAKRIVFAVLASIAMFTGTVHTASAAPPAIEAAKDEGLIGENINGYLEVITSVDPALKRQVDELNAARREAYAKLADQQGQSLSTVARLTGEKLVAGESSGRYVFDDSDRWVKK